MAGLFLNLQFEINADLERFHTIIGVSFYFSARKDANEQPGWVTSSGASLRIGRQLTTLFQARASPKSPSDCYSGH